VPEEDILNRRPALDGLGPGTVRIVRVLADGRPGPGLSALGALHDLRQLVQRIELAIVSGIGLFDLPDLIAALVRVVEPSRDSSNSLVELVVLALCVDRVRASLVLLQLVAHDGMNPLG